MTRLAVKRRELDRALGLARDAAAAHAQGRPQLALTIVRQAAEAERKATEGASALEPLAAAIRATSPEP